MAGPGAAAAGFFAMAPGLAAGFLGSIGAGAAASQYQCYAKIRHMHQQHGTMHQISTLGHRFHHFLSNKSETGIVLQNVWAVRDMAHENSVKGGGPGSPH